MLARIDKSVQLVLQTKNHGLVFGDYSTLNAMK